MVSAAAALERDGWAVSAAPLSPELMDELRATAFVGEAAGSRCLLDLPAVREGALQLRSLLAEAEILPVTAVAIQAIAFDKTAGTNWKVPWHQDVMFPFARAVTAEGYGVPSKKGGVDFARPPVQVLEELLAVRLHLDDCGPDNGPLRVCPGSHRLGLIPSSDAAAHAAREGEAECLAREGEVVLMKPLLLHASSQAKVPGRRRVLHFVYHPGTPVAEAWHRAAG